MLRAFTTLRKVLPAFVGIVLWSATALASKGGADAHIAENPSAAGLMILLFSFVNFFIFVYLIVRFAKRPLRDFLADRRKQLVEAMSAAARAKEEAEALKAEYQAKSAALEQARVEMVDEIKRLAEKDRERILAAAEEAGQRLRENAQRAAESELERARNELRAEAVALAAEIAQRDIIARLSDEERKRLVGDFLEAVE